MTLVVLATAWLAGVWLAAAVEWPLWLWLATAVVTFPPAWLLRRHGRLGLILAALTAAGLGGARYLVAQPVIDAGHVAFYNDQPDFVTLTGLVSDEPDVRDTYTNLRVAVAEIRFENGQATAVTGQVLVRAPRTPAILYGTEVEINGRLQTPTDSPDFSYRDYLARQGIHSTMSRPRLTVLAENAGSPLKHAIFALKARAQATITRILPDPQASLLTGILLGNDNGMPPALAEDFRATGLTHIIAISGDNITTLCTQMQDRFSGN